MTTPPEFIEDVEPHDEFLDKAHYDDDQYGWPDEVSDEDMDALVAPEQGVKVDPGPQDMCAQPEPIPEPIVFAVNALFDHYTYKQIREAVDRLHAARPHLGTAFSIWVTPDGSTLVNTIVPGVDVEHEASTEDIRRAARDVEEFHQHQRIAAMVRSVL